MKEYIPPFLPLDKDLETKNVLKKTIGATGSLKELKGIARLIPNQEILISFFALKEAKSSSEIENIKTTTDQLIGIADETENSKNVKEVLRYKDAMVRVFRKVKRGINDRLLITNNDIQSINSEILGYDSGYRKQSGTKIIDEKNDLILHTPPQKHEDILGLMDNLVKYLNTNDDGMDPLIKMAIIHYQFEVIHPFYDGNGRTGRVLNILYLVSEKYLSFPVLYLSSYINANKKKYYDLLQETRLTQNFEDWILYMLDGIEQTSNNTIKTIKDIKKLMEKTKHAIKGKNYYSKDLLECIFANPYTTSTILSKKLDINKRTAAKYLKELTDLGIMTLVKKKRGIENRFYNTNLISLLKKSNSGTK